MPYSSHREDRTAPGGVAAMHVHEALSSNYPFESQRHHLD